MTGKKNNAKEEHITKKARELPGKLKWRERFDKAADKAGLNHNTTEPHVDRTTSKTGETGGLKAAGEKIKKTITIFQLKKKLNWVKDHVMRSSKIAGKDIIGPEEQKFKILVKELDMLKNFNMLGFDSDAVNMLLGIYYMVELLNKDDKIATFLANVNVSEDEKNAVMEFLLQEWWEKVKLLPSYKERAAQKYRHLGTRVVIEKLYSKAKFVTPLNDIIEEINKYIKNKNIKGLIDSIRKAENFCDDLKKVTGRPKKRKYSGPIKPYGVGSL
ncbi:MAG: hypothetical protein KAW12_19770 [Candidatus Aminicenantes bacterium]|nr:hypothetical protein [Candidatus Aminicenantes bacterium]